MSKKTELEQVKKEFKQMSYHQWLALFLALFVIILRYLGMAPSLLYYPVFFACLGYVVFTYPKYAKLHREYKRAVRK